MKRTLLIALTIAIVCVLAVGGTFAYLQDTDSDVNVMALGNVDIQQNEFEFDDNGYLVPFENDKALLPYVGDLGWERNNYGDAYRQFSMENVVDKYVTITNVGNEEAYVRTWFALEMGDFTADEFELIGISNNAYNGSEFPFPGTWDWDYEAGTAVIDGNNYYLMCATHLDAVAPGEQPTIPSLCQVYLSKDATNEDVEKLDGNKNGKYEILVFSQAIQADGFADAETALNAGFGTSHPWADVALANDEAAVHEALAAGKDVALTADINIPVATKSNGYAAAGIAVPAGQTFDGSGYTLSVPGANTTWASALSASSGTIKNLTIDAGFRGIFVRGGSEQLVLDNVKINPTDAGTTVYTIHCDSASRQGLYAINSTFNGWTSYAATIGDVKFENCLFGAGAGYAFCRPYAPTEFVNCVFEAGYQIDARAAVTFENCTFGNEALTAENLASLVTYNTANATVK